MSPIASLRAATWQAHQRLERRLDVRQRFAHLSGYREHLQRMYGFCAALESRCEAVPLQPVLTDYPLRRKRPLLESDLQCLGVELEQCRQLPQCPGMPECAEPAAALGCLYVLEGATLGGRTLLPLVHLRLGMTAARGAAFLASYGEHIDAMWRSFGSAVDGWCALPARAACAASAAVATFSALERWLCGERT